MFTQTIFISARPTELLLHQFFCIRMSKAQSFISNKTNTNRCLKLYLLMHLEAGWFQNQWVPKFLWFQSLIFIVAHCYYRVVTLRDRCFGICCATEHSFG